MKQMDTTHNNENLVLNLRKQKQQIRIELNNSKERMSGILREITGPTSQTTGKKTGIMQWVSGGMAVYEGIKISYSIINALRHLFKRKSKRRF